MKRILKRTALVVLGALTLGSVFALAGTLSPSGPVGSTLHSLAEIYDSIAGTFDSTSVVADQNGNLTEQLKYIEANISNISSRPSSNSLNFDELANSLVLDADTAIASAGFSLDFGNTFLTAGSIVPDMTGATATKSAYNLGSPSRWWGDIYAESVHIGMNSLYMNGKKILSQNGDVMDFTADPDQSMHLETYGSGNLVIRSKDSGNLQMLSDQVILASSSAGVTLSVPAGAIGGNINIANQSLGGDILLNAAGSGANVFLSGTSGVFFTAPNITMTGGVEIIGTASVSALTVGGVAVTPGGSSYLPLSGGTLTGNLEVSGGYASISNALFAQNGNVGIGTTSPGQLFEVFSSTSNTPTIRITSDRALSVAEPKLQFVSGSGAGNYVISEFGALVGGGYANSKLILRVADTSKILRDRMIIDVNGNVGIGTTNVDAKLEVAGTASISGVANIGATGSNGDNLVLNGRLVLKTNGGTGTLYMDGSNNLYVPTIRQSAAAGRSGFIELNNTGFITARNAADTADIVLFTTDSSNKVLVGDATNSGTVVLNGNVGIGTTSPGSKLHLYTDGTADPLLKLEGKNGTDSLSLKLTHTNGTIGFALAGGSGAFMGTSVQHDAMLFGQTGYGLLFGLGGTEYMRIASTGNVGIGTTSPAQKLDVWGNFQAGTSSTPTLFVNTATGQVGIGKNNPTQALDVLGNINANNGIYIGGGGTWSMAGALMRIRSDATINWSGTTNATAALDLGLARIGASILKITDGSSGMGTLIAGNVGIGTTDVDAKLEVTGTASISNSFFVSSTGNVGVGTASPVTKLQVVGQNNHNNAIVIDNTAGYGAKLTNGTDAMAFRISNGNTFQFGDINGTNSPLSLITNGGTKLHIETGGNVGIGTTTPNSLLDVKGNIAASNSGNVDLVLNNTAASYGKFTIRSAAAPSAGRLDILGGAAGATNFMSVASTGNVGIGVRNPSRLLHVGSSSLTADYVLRLEDNDGACEHNPAAGEEFVVCSSDARLKTNIADYSGALDYLAGFRIRSYNLKVNGSSMTSVIAQELLQTHPELVASGSDGYLMVRQPNPWILVKGIQELTADSLQLNRLLSSGSIDTAPEGPLARLVRNILAYIKETLGIGLGDRQICIDDVCMTKDQLRQMLNNVGSANQSMLTPAPATTPVTTPDIAPTPSETPAPTPTPSDTPLPVDSPVASGSVQ